VINFGIIYGMGAFRLANELNISQKMAKTYIDHYFARPPGVKRFLDRTIEEARRSRRTSTLLGRIRLLPDINSPNAVIRQAAERTAINTPIQGSAADLIKVAMIRIDAALGTGGFKAAMLLTVHDELVFEVPPDGGRGDAVGAGDHGRSLGIEGAAQGEYGHGSNWAEAHWARRLSGVA
jgi:DNA polymerase-1